MRDKKKKANVKIRFIRVYKSQDRLCMYTVILPTSHFFFIRNLEITDTFYFRYESIIEKKLKIFYKKKP